MNHKNKQKLVNNWVAGYYSGYSEGIKSVIRILRGAESGPFSKEAREEFVILSDALEEQMSEMVKQQMDHLADEDE
jgi:hypothetical protein